MFKFFITFSILCSFPFASPVAVEKNRLLVQNKALLRALKTLRSFQDSEVSVGMTNSELIERLCAEQTHLFAKEVKDAVKEILEHIASTLENGDRVEIRGFGSFSLHYREPRESRNPKTGEKVELEGKYVPHFKPGLELRERVNLINRETAVGATTKKELSDNLVDKLGFSQRDAKETVEVFFEEIRKALESGEPVKLSGFGNFDLRDKNERPGRNPKTGEDIPITARRVVTFRPGQKLMKRVAHIRPE